MRSTDNPARPLSRTSRVLIIDPDGGNRRAAARVFRSLVDVVEEESSPPQELREDGYYDLIAMSHDACPAPDRDRILERYGRHDAKTRLLLFSEATWHDTPSDLFHSGNLMNLLARNHHEVIAEDLLVTAKKILSADIFGLEKYFGWGAEEVRYRVTRSSQKSEFLENVRDYATRIGVTHRLISHFCMVADEFLTNAIYNAPVDEHGNFLYASRSRALEVVLPEEQALEVRLCSDGRRIGISAADPFGSLRPQLVLEYLAKCFRRGSDQIDDKPGGAGLGLYQSFDAVSHLIFNISPKKCCECIGLIDIRGSFKDFAQRPKSFNMFVTQSAPELASGC